MLGVASDGRLLSYARSNGDWNPAAPTVVATGWLNKYRQLLLPGDINAESKPDLLLGRTRPTPSRSGTAPVVRASWPGRHWVRASRSKTPVDARRL